MPRLIGLGLVLLALAWVGADPVRAQSGPPELPADALLLGPTEAPVPPFAVGRVLVGVQPAEVEAAGADMPWTGLPVTAALPLDLRTGEAAAASPSLAGYQLTVPAGEEWTVIEALQTRPGVVFAEPDWLAQIAQAEVAAPVLPASPGAFAVNDALYPDQWYLQRIGISRAWETALNEGGAGLTPIVVAVLDTGADFTHPDLVDRLLPGRNYLVPGGTPQDDNGHGTHISGLIAAGVNNGGMAGAGWDARVLPMKVLDANGFGSVATIAQALRDAADGGVPIINLSLEVSVDSFVLRSAIEYAAAQGALLIAAAGNCGGFSCPPPVRYPAAYPAVLAVASTTYFDGVADYSAEGPELDIAAPGGGGGRSILSTWSADAVARCRSGLRVIDGGYYCLADGTSMAAGVVSGVAALVWSVQPELSAAEVRARLMQASVAVAAGGQNDVGSGRVDAERAVRMGLRPRLYFDVADVNVRAELGAAAVTRTLTLYNPSLEPLTWTITPTAATDWYAVVGPQAGSVGYASPATTQLVLTPTHMGPGVHLGSYRVVTTDPDGGTTVYGLGVALEVVTPTATTPLYVPIVIGSPPVYTWRQPDAAGRTVYTVFDYGNFAAALPFTMTVAGRSYTDLRVYDDGFLAFGASAAPPALPTRCVANQVWPSLTVYGWWSNLFPEVGVSRLSTFVPEPGQFVVEYEDFQKSGSLDPADRVSFQIVLYATGRVDLNYRTVPAHSPVSVTVGVAAADGRFYNQVACRLPGYRVGELPQADQTIIILPEDLY